jgi:hypothetical protein
MAFQTSRNSTNQTNTVASTSKPAFQSKAVSSDVASDVVKSINITGMYDGKPGSKLVAKGGKLLSDITIPAGYSLKLFQKGGKSKNGKDLPTYELVAQPPRSV